MKKIIVLGAGLVGGVMADDLAKNHNVTSVDISKKNLDNITSNNVKKICQDISDTKSLQKLVVNYDLVIGARIICMLLKHIGFKRKYEG